MKKPLKNEDIKLPYTDFRESIYNELLKSFKFMNGNYPPDLYRRIKDEFEYTLATFMMDSCQGSVTKASRVFGEHKNLIKRHIRKFGIDHNLYKKAYRMDAYGVKRKTDED